MLKQLQYIILISLLLTGCGDDFLELTNPNAVSYEEYWQTYDEFVYGLNAAYTCLQYPAVSGHAMACYDRTKTDLCRTFEFYNQTNVFSDFNWSETEPYISVRWNGLYVGIYRVNQVLDNLKNIKVSGSFTQTQINELDGQARFLRALYYFWLANSYNGAVIHTTVPTDDDNINTEFSSYDVVINNVVIPDLLIAIDHLPEIWPESDLGRATQGAAKALLGKVYLYQDDFTHAETQFKEVIESGTYSLTSDIGDNFSLDGEFNSESIFEVNFSEAQADNITAGIQESFPDVGQAGHAVATASFVAPDSRGGLRFVVPTFWLTELYLKDSIDLENSIDTSRRWSNRAYYSIAFIDQDGEYYLQSSEKAAPWYIGGAECAYWKKSSNWATKSNEDSWSGTRRSGINERMIRLADIKLMYAEALLRKPNSSLSDFDEALEHVDDIRRRAGVLTLQHYADNNSMQIPQFHLRGSAPFSSPWVALSPESLLTHIMRVERPLELAFEGNSIRWHDLRRWGLINDVLVYVGSIDYTINWMIKWYDKDIPSMVYPEGNALLIEAIDKYQGSTPADNYNPAVHNYFPIPLNEQSSNPDINP